MKPFDLRCEYQIRPLGLSESRPRFSWKLPYATGGRSPADYASSGRPADGADPQSAEASSSRPATVPFEQTAYRVQVASSPEAIARAEPDIWDTGRVESRESVHIEYAGPRLEAFSRYYWTVTVWDATGREYSASSGREETAQASVVPGERPAGLRSHAEFWTGALESGDWQADWITSSHPLTYDSSDSPFVDAIQEYHAMYFHKRFSLPGRTAAGENSGTRATGSGRSGTRPIESGRGGTGSTDSRRAAAARNDSRLGGTRPADSRLRGTASTDGRRAAAARNDSRRAGVRRAQLCVSARGVVECYLNGTRVGDAVIDPAPTNYEQVALYSAYDVTELLAADNAIGLILGNGRHLASYGYGVPSLSLMLIIEDTEGNRTVLRSDGSWRCGTGPIAENGIYFGECYDARREIPAWATPDQDTSGWDSASVVDPVAEYSIDVSRATPVASSAPRHQTIDPIRVTRILDAVQVWSPKPGEYVFDFGQNLTGVTELAVAGPGGTTVTVCHSELVDEAGNLNTLPNRNARATNAYTLAGRGLERYRPSLTQHGFRYALVRGHPGTPTPKSLKAVCFHTAAAEVGELSTSKPLLNDVHRITRWSARSNLMGIPTDCPQRDERMGWLGDAQLASEQALYNFDMAGSYTKYLEDIRLSQREDGALSNVVPDYWKLYPADPAWGSAYATIAWNMYFHYGDKRILERHFDGIARYVGYLDSVADEGIIDSIVMIGDWCPPGSITPKRTPAELTSTWYYYHDTVLLARMAEVLGRDDEHQRLQASARRIREAFNERFLKDYGYAVNQMTPTDVMPSQTSNVLPLYLDMVPSDALDLVVGRLLESVVKHHDYHLDTGIVGTRYLFDVLTKLGYDEVAYRIATQTSYPGWGYMLREGATTLWEHWEKIEGEGMNSNNHIMLGSVDAWYYSTLSGLRCVAPGWRAIDFAPHPVGDLRFAAATVETILGRAAISWELEPDAGHPSNPGSAATNASTASTASTAPGGRFRCAITVPGGAKARFVLPPGRSATEISIDGRSADRVPPDLAPGHHQIELSLSPRTPPKEPQWREFNALRRSISPGRIG